jgi:hypothetical protein
MDAFDSSTRVSLTERGWLYQAGQTMSLANRCTDGKQADLLQEQAKKMLAASVRAREQEIA